MWDILTPFLGSMVRHALTLVAGSLVTYGVLRQSQTEQFVAACMLFAGIGWAAWHKINTPQMLGRLQDRMVAKNQRSAATGEVFRSSPLAVAAFLGGFAVLSMFATTNPAGAQGLLDYVLPGPAKAQAPRRQKHMRPPMKAGLSSLINRVEGGPSIDPIELMFSNLKRASIQDLEYAKALAEAAKDSPAAQARARCYGAWLGLLASLTSAETTLGADAKPGALTSVFTKFEQLSQINDNLAPMSSFQQACAPVAQAMRMSITTFVSQVVGGGLSLSKLGLIP